MAKGVIPTDPENNKINKPDLPKTTLPEKPEPEINIKIIDFLTKQAERSDQKVESYKKELDVAINRWIKILSAILAIISGVLMFLGYNSWKNIQDDIEKTKKEINQKTVEEIKKNLSTNEIQVLIQRTVQEYTTAEIEMYMSKRVDARLNPINKRIDEIFDRLDQKSNSLEILIDKTSQKIETLTGIITILRLSEEALAGSYKSFKQLESYSDATDEVNIMARLEYNKIIMELNDFKNINDTSSLEGVSFISGEVYLPASNFDLKTIIDNMKYLSKPKAKACIKDILKKDKTEIFEIAVKEFENPDNLFVCAALGSALAELYKQQHNFKNTGKIKHLAFTLWKEYCKQELAKIKQSEQQKKDEFRKTLYNFIHNIKNPVLNIDKKWIDKMMKENGIKPEIDKINN